MPNNKKKRTNFNNLSVRQLQNPLRYLVYKKKEYTKEYLRQLPYILKKRIDEKTRAKQSTSQSGCKGKSKDAGDKNRR